MSNTKKSTTVAKFSEFDRACMQIAREDNLFASVQREGPSRDYEHIEVFSVRDDEPVAIQRGFRCLVMHDTTTDAVTCTCNNAYDNDPCGHRGAVLLYVEALARAITQALDPQRQAQLRAEQHERDTALLRRSNRPFSLLK